MVIIASCLDDVICPEISEENQIGYCSFDKCPAYDGKRCKQLGFQPKGVCEVWVMDILEKLRFYQQVYNDSFED